MKTKEITEKIHDGLHEGKEKIAEKLDDMGNTIEEKVDRLRDMSDKAALRLHYGADRVRSMNGDACREILNKYPLGSMAAAVVFGVLVGRLFKRSS